jgi:hypothetical protein
MSENQNSTVTASEGQQDTTNGANENAQQPTQYMFWQDPLLQQWTIHPYYLSIFQNQLNIIENLQEIVNQKWSQ